MCASQAQGTCIMKGIHSKEQGEVVGKKILQIYYAISLIGTLP